MLDFHDVNALGQILDTTFGRSSTVESATRSVKASLVNNEYLHIKYAAVVNFNGYQGMATGGSEHEDEAAKVIDLYLKEVKNSFKTRSGKTLKIKMSETDSSWELISAHSQTPRKSAYFRFEAVVEIEVKP